MSRTCVHHGSLRVIDGGAAGELPAAPPAESTLLADAHVHFYRGYDRGVFFQSAVEHVRRAAGGLGLPPTTPGCLLLAESRGEQWFRRCRDEAAAGRRAADGWMLAATAEEDSLVVRRGWDRLFLIAGRQIVAREGIEVLALATDAELPDGLPLADVLGWIGDRGALAVLPWGFGKWWGARGAAVRQALRRHAGERLFLGDSGGRPQAGPAPRLLREAADQRTRILPGSDPLPLPGEERRAGSYGFVVRGAFDERRPAASLRRLVPGAALQPPAYGRRTGLLGFAAAQLALRLRPLGTAG
jgi:hypothetical protein